MKFYEVFSKIPSSKRHRNLRRYGRIKNIEVFSISFAKMDFFSSAAKQKEKILIIPPKPHPRDQW